jgi:hypothetical protein
MHRFSTSFIIFIRMFSFLFNLLYVKVYLDVENRMVVRVHGVDFEQV